jgi:hypothetical protein
MHGACHFEVQRVRAFGGLPEEQTVRKWNGMIENGTGALKELTGSLAHGLHRYGFGNAPLFGGRSYEARAGTSVEDAEEPQP